MQPEGQGSLCLALWAVCAPGAELESQPLRPIPKGCCAGKRILPHPLTGDRNKGAIPRALLAARTQGRQPVTKVNCVPAPKTCACTRLCTFTYTHIHMHSQSPVWCAPGLQACQMPCPPQALQKRHWCWKHRHPPTPGQSMMDENSFAKSSLLGLCWRRREKLGTVCVV